MEAGYRGEYSKVTVYSLNVILSFVIFFSTLNSSTSSFTSVSLSSTSSSKVAFQFFICELSKLYLGPITVGHFLSNIFAKINKNQKLIVKIYRLSNKNSKKNFS
jgi:hypothetical protein